MSRLRILALTLFIFAVVPAARAYPSFISYGYGSCLSCHFNPLGNGPLTDYGRAVSATAISGKPFYDLKATDDELGESSGFLGAATKHLPDFVRPSVQYRGLILASRIQDGPTWRRYTMKADAQLVLRAPEDKIVASGTLGYIPALSPGDNTLISREHFVGARFGENWGAYAGLMDIAYGLRIPDHNAVNRRNTGLAQNDQTHGVLGHYTSEKLEAAAHAFVGNLTQDAALRPKGVAATAECQVWEKNRLGVSLLRSSNDFRTNTLGAVHHRIQFREGSGLISEAGLIRTVTSAPSTQTGPYLFAQALHRIFRGFHLIGTAEYASAQFSGADKTYRLAPGIQWFVMQRVELRLDLSFAWRRGVNGSPNTFSFDGLGQTALTF